MFIIHHFNQPDLFKNLLFQVIDEKKLPNPMQSEIILVDNNIMAKWMKIELASYFNIAANFDFMNIKSFMKKVYRKILLDNSINDNFSYFNMFWKFMKILPKIGKLENCDILQNYLRDDYYQRKCGQCAEQLANLFTQYLIYRPDWLNLWASCKIIKNVDFSYQVWQSEIWRTFLKYVRQYDDNSSSANLINPWEYCINFLKTVKHFDHNIPNRIFIFGITFIAPIFWKILKILSRDIDIYLGFMNLGYYNWNNISSQDLLFNTQLNCRRSILCNSFEVNNLYDNEYHDNDINHPLLERWGNIGKNTLHFLSIQLKNVLEIKTYSNVNNDSLLHILQKEILEFKKYMSGIVSKRQKKYVLELDDQSITFHICHNIQREVEILHDNLLSMFIDDPLLSPGDIIVMAPDICVYEAAINSVFNNINGRDLPFTITNYQDVYMHTITSTFLNILEIFYKNKFTSEEILSLLSVSLVANRFDINEEELKLLYKWTYESGIRWGLDKINIYSEHCSIPIKINKNTWYFGLSRMLMGYMIDSQYGVWNDILPYDSVVTQDIDIIEKLGKFLTILKKWKERLHKSYTLQVWLSYIKEIINDFFYYSNVDVAVNIAIIKLKTNCVDMLMIGIQSGYLDCINIITLKDQLFCQLNQSNVIYRFLPNVIKFCNIIPICAIPCKIICFLGINKDVFPSNNVSYSFNLIEKQPRYGDINIYERDCYAFLSALLLARDKVYISCVGYHVHDYSAHILSTIINELLEYISTRFCLRGDEYFNIEENIEHIRQHLFQWHNPFIFSLENFSSRSKYQSFAEEWFFFNNIHSTENNLYIKPWLYNINILPKYTDNVISCYDLYKFYSHPIRAWSQKRLGVHFDQKFLLNLFNDEPFSVKMIDYFSINMKLIDYLVYNKDIDQLYNEIRCSGILPYGSFGELFWVNQCEKMNVLSNKIKKYIFFEKRNLNISLEFDKIKLIGQLPNVRENGLFRWKPSRLSMKDVFLLWLEHIIYCAIGGTGRSILFGIDDNTWCCSNVSMLHAKELLLFLVKGYLSGMNTPLFLLYRTGGSWIYSMFNWSTKSISIDYDCQKNANRKLVQMWKGLRYKDNDILYPIKGESDDPYLRMFLPFDLSTDDINKIINTAKKYFIHPMMNRIFINNF